MPKPKSAASTAPNQSNLLTPTSFNVSKSNPSLAYRFRLIGLIDKSIRVLKILDSHCFSDNNNSPFSEEFYNGIVKRNESLKPGDVLLSYISVFNDIPVGALCAKLRDGATEGAKDFVITHLCVLPAYRKLGVASQTIHEIQSLCQEHNHKDSSDAADQQDDQKSKKAKKNTQQEKDSAAVVNPITRLVMQEEHSDFASQDQRQQFLEKIGFQQVDGEWILPIPNKKEE